MLNQELRIRKRLENRVPNAALDYCFNLWKEAPFYFKVAGNRKTKWGDFRIDSKDRIPQISVNEGLNPFQFTITYVHEIAHWRVYAAFGNTVSPHGIQWKRSFQHLMEPLLKEAVFPADLLRVLKLHMRNPKASTGADPRMLHALMKFDENAGGKFLYELLPGEDFSFRGTPYKKEGSRRTRALCLNLTNGKKYLIPEVIKVD